MVTRIWPVLVPLLLVCLFLRTSAQTKSSDTTLRINDLGYYEGPGVNVMLFDDFYPDGHQGGLTIIQCGRRVAANGDLRLEPTPGQWSPVPKVGPRIVEKEKGAIRVRMWYPDSSKDRTGFNPIPYPDLRFSYTVTTSAVGAGIRLTVDLDSPLPPEWAGRVGFNLEIFPGEYFGEHYLMDGRPGLFPRQAEGPVTRDGDGHLQISPLAVGKRLVVAPGNREKEIRFASNGADLQLIDGRGLHNNGWYVLRSTIPAGAVTNAVEWTITPTGVRDWRYTPVVQVSQVGYHPHQTKFAVVELDRRTDTLESIQLIRIDGDSTTVVKADPSPAPWGTFLRYRYLRYDFSGVTDEGLYRVRYGKSSSNEFEIRRDIFARHVWQPTLQYFLPVQMCHMRIEDRYKVWHGLCHMDDARMAPVNHNHFDGYYQHASTLTTFVSGQHVHGLSAGGWHDAGDYDIRVESQAETIYKLALAYEYFKPDDDETLVDQEARVVIIHRPDGKADILQQIEHGVLSIIGGFEAMDRLYRGIICPTLEQYVHLGDGSTMTDNLIYDERKRDPIMNRPLPEDDRWVFTEDNPQRELYVAQALAAAHRVLKQYNSTLSEKCLRISQILYQRNASADALDRINAAAELYVTTSDMKYAALLLANAGLIGDNVMRCSEVIGRVVEKLGEPEFTRKIEKAVKSASDRIAEQQKENPYGVPYKPYIWGAGWGIQSFGVKQLFLHLSFPKLVSSEYAFNALDFVLGCHPGENTSSFVSGVGARSLAVAYGVNRDEWSSIPGGVGSGTALIRPDLPELKVWPYLWQQTEYVLGGGTVDFMILAIAADHLLNE
jgi:endoglucanase